MRWMASKTMNTEMRMRKTPFAKPDRVSMRPYLKSRINFHPSKDEWSPYPYVYCSLGSHVAITEAKSPTPMAMQSNAI